MSTTSRQVEDGEMLAGRLRKAGLKATRPRLLVLGLLHELGGHHTVDELAQELHTRDTPLPRGSVYNVIGVLVSQGLVMLADTGPGSALYEECVTWHHHFVCIECGVVIDIPCVKGEKPCLLPDWVPGVVEEAQIIFRGRCSNCLSKADDHGNDEGKSS